jgi:hypothetical protein
MALRKRADTYYAMNDFAKAVPDLEAALKLSPGDPDIMQNLQHVQAKMATPRPVVRPPATPTPAPTPEPMSMQMKLGIGGAALVVIIILVIVFSRKKSRGY